jgi:hypothetical protein
VSIKGGPYQRFRRALAIGRLPLVLAAAAELPRLDVADALEVLLLMADQDEHRYPRAAARWLGRLALERPGVTLADVRLAAAACEVLPVQPEVVGLLRALASR